uniref:Uncharacterized protein n=1 Tax=Neovison vison TaxID=452646 RepID=A0A8C7EQL7_NEOVI
MVSRSWRQAPCRTLSRDWAAMAREDLVASTSVGVLVAGVPLAQDIFSLRETRGRNLRSLGSLYPSPPSLAIILMKMGCSKDLKEN